VTLSQTIVNDDTKSIESLGKMQREMMMMINNIESNSPVDESAVHPMISVFYIYDLKSIVEYLAAWVEEMNLQVIRFTSDKDQTLPEEVFNIRKLSKSWIDKSRILLSRNEKTTSGQKYIALYANLENIQLEIEEWMVKLELRVGGDDGTSIKLVQLHNNVDDRHNSYSNKELDKPLLESDRQTLKNNLSLWTGMISSLIANYANTTALEQQKVPLHVETWSQKVLDHLNADTDVRNEDNMKLHIAIVSWIVQLLVKETKGKFNDPTTASEYDILHADVFIC
jgi:hypothetical protein